MNQTQFRMAKGALGWTSIQTARSAGVRTATVNRFLMEHDISPYEWKLLRQAFVDAGVLFLPADEAGTGIRIKDLDVSLGLKIERAKSAIK